MVSAVILAAGLGTRAWPYAGSRQKVTLPVLNVPILRRLALDLQALGVKEIVCVVGHRGHAARACIADLPGVSFVVQQKPTGTADAAMLGLTAVTGEDVVVCYGDIVTTRDDLRRLLDGFGSGNAPAQLLAANRLPSSTIAVVLEIGKGGEIQGLTHCTRTRGRLLYGGIVVAKAQILQQYLLRNPGMATNIAGAMPLEEADLANSLDLMCQDGIDVGMVNSKDFVVDVDKPWQLVEANVQARQRLFESIEQDVCLAEGSSISEKAEISEGVKLRLGKGARIGDYCRVTSSVVLEDGAALHHGVFVRNDGGIVVGARTQISNYCGIGGRSVIGADCVIGHGAEYQGVAFDNVSIRHPAEVCAVLGSRVNVAGGVTTGNWRFDDDIKTQVVGKHKEKPERYGELTYVGDYVRIGNGAMFSPGMRVGSYSCIGPGVWVSEDVPERSLILLKQEIVRREWDARRYGW